MALNWPHRQWSSRERHGERSVPLEGGSIESNSAGDVHVGAVCKRDAIERSPSNEVVIRCVGLSTCASGRGHKIDPVERATSLVRIPTRLKFAPARKVMHPGKRSVEEGTGPSSRSRWRTDFRLTDLTTLPTRHVRSLQSARGQAFTAAVGLGTGSAPVPCMLYLNVGLSPQAQNRTPVARATRGI